MRASGPDARILFVKYFYEKYYKKTEPHTSVKSSFSELNDIARGGVSLQWQ